MAQACKDEVADPLTQSGKPAFHCLSRDDSIEVLKFDGLCGERTN